MLKDFNNQRPEQFFNANPIKFRALVHFECKNGLARPYSVRRRGLLGTFFGCDSGVTSGLRGRIKALTVRLPVFTFKIHLLH